MHHKARLATIAVVGLLVGASPALAEKAPTDSGRQMTVDRTTTAVEINTTVSIPTLEAAGSNIDGDTLKAILTGKAPDRIADLSTLSATSIHIPEVRVEVVVPAGPKMGDGKFIYTYKDIELEGVNNGVAQSAVVGTAEQSGGDGISMSFGKMSATDFDVGGVLAIYGMVPSVPDQPLKTIYSDFSIADGKVAAHDVQCDIGSLTTKSFKARPLKTSFADLMKLVSAPELQKGDASLSPDLVSKLLGFYIDLFDGVEIAPINR